MKSKVFFILYCSFIAVAIVALMLMYYFAYGLYPLKYKNEIIRTCKLTDMDPAIVASIINTESSFDKNIVSSSGAVGLMQIMPTTAEYICNLNYITYDYSRLFDAEFNIYIGELYLKYLSQKFDDFNVILCAYNAGEGRVKQWLNNKDYSVNKTSLSQIPYKETNDYVQKVNRGVKFYKTRF